jgi:acetyl-CoA carboxylase biotin carboxyl carrier protein
MSAEPLLTPEDVAEVVAILDGTAYQRFEIRTSRFTLKVARSGEGWTQEWDWAAGESPAAQLPGDASAAAALPQPVAEAGLTFVRSPLPGTFYRAPQPGAPPYVQVGDKVERTSVVGIVETMKLMNSIHAGVAGTVVKIAIENATSIDADTILMQVRTD